MEKKPELSRLWHINLKVNLMGPRSKRAAESNLEEEAKKELKKQKNEEEASPLKQASVCMPLESWRSARSRCMNAGRED